jgi:hypothetical protein
VSWRKKEPIEKVQNCPCIQLSNYCVEWTKESEKIKRVVLIFLIFSYDMRYDLFEKIADP